MHLGPPQDHLGPGVQSYQRFAADGMTELAIFARLLAEGGMRPDRGRVDQLVKTYLKQLPAELERQGCWALPGIEQLVLGAREAGHAVVVGTGLARQAAEIKLGQVKLQFGSGSLHDLLPDGGYGSDSVDRAKLLRIAAQRGAAMLGKPLADCDVVIVGDTPRDALGAAANRSPLLGVGTGGYGPQLQQAGITVLRDLAQPDALEIVLAGGRLDVSFEL